MKPTKAIRQSIISNGTVCTTDLKLMLMQIRPIWLEVLQQMWNKIATGEIVRGEADKQHLLCFAAYLGQTITGNVLNHQDRSFSSIERNNKSTFVASQINTNRPYKIPEKSKGGLNYIHG